MIPTVTLKSRREIPVKAGHPWVFSNALVKPLNAEPGTLVRLLSAEGEFLGIGFYNPLTSIRVRVLVRGKEETIDKDFLLARFKELARRKESLLPPETTAYRLVHADADDLPGLIADIYEDVCVFQMHTAGMDRLRPQVLEALQSFKKFKAVVERSDVNVRQREGLEGGPVSVHLGSVPGPVLFKENGLAFSADVLKGQKTGFYLDQRETRQAVRHWSQGRRVLNLFGYTGAFSVYAQAGGAREVLTVDSSKEALETAKKHFELNQLSGSTHSLLKADAFDYAQNALHRERFDLVVCDPPAFAKSLDKKRNALEAYLRINALCFGMLEPGGILASSSCSGVISSEEFRDVLRIAAGQAKREVRVLGTLGQPLDHTDKLSFPEGRYLKTCFLEALK